MPDEATLTYKRYLADGVYAGFDGYQIWLWVERENGKHFIALEQETLSELNYMASQIVNDRIMNMPTAETL